jgi:transcription termination factor Rho
VAETHAPEESPLDVRSVAAALGVSPTTLYKYGFNREINAAEQRQREDVHVSGREIERRSFHDQVQGMSQELEKERERNKALVARIAIMEANAARLGFDPEEMYKPILKPVRTVSRAGAIRGTGRRGKGRF